MELEVVRFHWGPSLDRPGDPRFVLAEPIVPCLLKMPTRCMGQIQFSGHSNGQLKVGILRMEEKVWEPRHPYGTGNSPNHFLKGHCGRCGNDVTMPRGTVDEIMLKANKWAEGVLAGLSKED